MSRYFDKEYDEVFRRVGYLEMENGVLSRLEHLRLVGTRMLRMTDPPSESGPRSRSSESSHFGALGSRNRVPAHHLHVRISYDITSSQNM